MEYVTRNKRFERLSDEELLYKLLQQRGVDNPKKLLQLNESCLLNAKSFNHIQEGMSMLTKHLNNKSDICIVVDSDADGYTSSAFSYLWLKNYNEDLNINYVIHSGKQHGILLEELEDIKYDLLIVPDAGSNNKNEIRFLNNKGKDIIVLDHHQFKEDLTNSKTIIINNQDGSYGNQTLSGVGVVYKFFNLYEHENKCYNYSDDLLDLVAVGMIGDIMDLRNYETRFLCLKGIDLMNIQDKGNTFLNAIIEKLQGRMGDCVTISKIGWYITPLINGVVRSGTMEEKYDTFKALINTQETRMYQPRRKSIPDPNNPDKKIMVEQEPIKVSLQQDMVRVIINVKSRQDRLVSKEVKNIQDEIKGSDIEKDKIMMLDVTGKLDREFTGYIANSFAQTYKRPVLVYTINTIDNKEVCNGSGRNYDKFEAIDNLRTFLLDTGDFNEVAGHNSAFGISIDKDKIMTVQNKLNKLLANAEIKDVYHVDYAVSIGRLKPKQVLQVGQFDYMWGNMLDEPLFAITDVKVAIKDIELIGDKQNILRFYSTVQGRDITFIKFMKGKETYEQLTNVGSRGFKKSTGDYIYLDIIGKFKINEWKDKQYAQIEVVDFNKKTQRVIDF